jgi:hypothetical protein
MLVSFRLEIVLILTQDRCTVCTECTKGSKIILDAPDGNSQVTGLKWNLIFSPFGDSVSVGARFTPNAP